MPDGTQPPGIGETLRAARRRQGHTLADVAEGTRARETYLAAIEQEEFDALGGDVYARGFITSYAKFLGLDPEPLLVAYQGARRSEARHGRPRAAARRPGERGVRVRSGRVAVLLLLMLVIVVALVVAGLAGGDAGAATLAVLLR